ncbi:MAG TPA: hypothetical protein VGK21_06815 [Candidatus Angelobacter sp.]
MKNACILLVAIFALSSISLSQANTSRAAYPAGTLSSGINLRAMAGAPFSADVISQSTLMLADGTPFTQETHGKMFRDTAGRTRSETELQSTAAGGTRHFVTIVDPMQGTSIVLDVAAKSATVFHLPAMPAVSANKVNLAVASHAARANMKRLALSGSEALGAMMMEGFAVIGTRRAGAASVASATTGASPNVVTESWFSKELKVDLLVSRQGQSASRTTRLTNIAPGEPDPTLFQVPADYTVRDNSQAKGVTQ